MKQSHLEYLKEKFLNRCFLTSRSQARYRGQEWHLTREEFFDLWGQNDNWAYKGRAVDDLTLSRLDMSGAWEISNVEITTRLEMLKREALFKKGE